MTTRNTWRNRIVQVDALAGLRQLRDESIDCVVTSPPYWALRDYGVRPLNWGGHADCPHNWAPSIRRSGVDRRTQAMKVAQGTKVGSNINTSEFAVRKLGRFCRRCGAWKGSLGLEPTSELYLDHLLYVFDAIQRVLRPSGTCWVNLMDAYAGSWGHGAARDSQQPLRMDTSREYVNGSVLRSKKLLVDSPKCLCLIPERFAVMMVARGWILRNRIVWHKPNHMPSSTKDRFTCSWEYLLFFVKQRRYYFDLDAVRVPHSWPARQRASPAQRNKMPACLSGARPPPEPGESHAFAKAGKNPGDCWNVHTKPFPEAHFAVFPEKLAEVPIKAGCPPGGLVLDPFMGSGTTALVARKLGRDYLGFDAKPSFVKMALRRLDRLNKARNRTRNGS